ncbi:thioredoxin [Alicyclobacillus cellulosilyticus]|uniref:Thioredoxin n=1 Tax=Alicyclobacillus cellulosilyticus TaxID=1003997 RepID=A0A917K2S5_9BACL|nr:TlpA disulfide reductase family protein [Alicyclobacillus cellulosilyticus]GGI96667.1 thioredoxin [Alicyclobacillus cellulosilyticus]
MKTSAKWVLGASAVFLAGMAAVWTFKQNSSATAKTTPATNRVREAASVTAAPQTGHKMPPFTLPAYPDHKTISTDSLAGKPIFINFWTSWCDYCKQEMPDLVKAYQKFGDKVEFLSINGTSMDSVADVKRFVQDYGIVWPVALDTKGIVMNEYHILGFPTSFFVNRQGIIVGVNQGMVSKDQLMTELERIAAS